MTPVLQGRRCCMQIYRSFQWRFGNIFLLALAVGLTAYLARAVWEFLGAIAALYAPFVAFPPAEAALQWFLFLGSMFGLWWIFDYYAEIVRSYGWWFGYWQKFRLFIRLFLDPPLKALVALAFGLAFFRLLNLFYSNLGVPRTEYMDFTEGAGLLIVALIGFSFGLHTWTDEKQHYQELSRERYEIYQHVDLSFTIQETPWDKLFGQLHRWLRSFLRGR